MNQDKKKVIIVDDDPDLLDILVFSLESEGFEVKGISSGIEALNYLKQKENLETVSLLIMDRLLQDMDGLDILSQVPGLPKQVPVLILSVLSSEKDILAGLKAGAIDYMEKPFSLPILIEKALVLINRENR